MSIIVNQKNDYRHLLHDGDDTINARESIE
jgi:hypothetical protein